MTGSAALLLSRHADPAPATHPTPSTPTHPPTHLRSNDLGIIQFANKPVSEMFGWGVSELQVRRPAAGLRSTHALSLSAGAPAAPAPQTHTRTTHPSTTPLHRRART